MRNTRIEIPEWITDKTVEHAYHRAQEALENHEEDFANVGMRAAIDKNPRLLLTLDKSTEVLAMLVENQVGRYQRTTEKYGHKAELTELGLWRNALEQTDKTHSDEDERYYALYPYRFILGAAAELAGLRP